MALQGFVPWPEDRAARYRAAGLWAGITVAEMVERTARELPNKAALVQGERRVTYAELIDSSKQLATALLDLGLKPQERVVMQLPNVPEFAIVYLALQWMGAIPVMALRAHRHAEVRHFIGASGAAAYVIADRIGDFDYRPMADEMLEAFPSVLRYVVVAGEAGEGQHTLSRLLHTAPDDALLAAARPDPSDVCTMLLSGGTTSMSKLIPRTHDDYVLNARLCAKAAGFDRDTVFMADPAARPQLQPRIAGHAGHVPRGRHGGADDGRRRRGHLLHRRAREGQRHRGGGAAHRQLAQQRRAAAARPVVAEGRAERRRAAAAGAARAAARALRLHAAGDLRHRRRPDQHDAARRPGRAAAAQLRCAGERDDDEIKVLDDDDREVPDGEPGELVTRGPYTINGYYNAPAKNAEAFTADGFYRMGDIVRKRGRYVYTEGRRKDLINRGGEKISCDEVESLIVMHPKVKAVALVAMPDPVFGEKACACVICNEGEVLGFDELIAFLRAQRIASFKLPERLVLMKEFPLSPVGKILKRELREAIAGGHA